MAELPTVSRARYYDALIRNLDREIRPELQSERARFLYGATRRILARLAVANAHTPPLPENLAAAHPDAPAVAEVPLEPAALHAALRAEGTILDSIEEAVSQRVAAVPIASAGAQLAPITLELLQAYVDHALGATTRVQNFQILAGGRSKQTIMLNLVDGEGVACERVIRRDLLVALTGASVVDEYQLLIALTARGYPAPRPLLLEVDPRYLGSAFMIMEKVQGAVAGDVFDPPPGREAVLESAAVLGRLHALDAEQIAPSVREASRAGLNAARLQALIVELEQAWRSNVRAPSHTMDTVFQWLRDNAQRVEPVSTVVHGDFSFHNLLYVDGRLSAVMDWELVRIGHPAEDVGYIRAAALQAVDWADFMAAYQAGGGPALIHRDVVFFSLLGKLRLLSLLFFARQYFESGATDDLQLADVCVYHLPRLIHQSSEEIRGILGIAR